MQNSKGHISAKHAPNSLPKTSLKSLFLRLSFCVEIILVSGFFGAQADSIYHCFGSGIWARHEPEPKHSRQQLIPKPRDFLISCGWKIYPCCNSNNSTEGNNATGQNMCKLLYSTEEFALFWSIAAILFSKDIRCNGQAQMSWISGDGDVFEPQAKNRKRTSLTPRHKYRRFFSLIFSTSEKMLDNLCVISCRVKTS